MTPEGPLSGPGVLVVGAGAAGRAAAIALARRLAGRSRVVLVGPPREASPGTEPLYAEGWSALTAGSPAPLAREQRALEPTTRWLAGRRDRRAPIARLFAGPLPSLVERAEVEAWLDQECERAGVERIFGRALGLLFDDSRAVGATIERGEGETEELESRAVCVADGAAGRVSRQLRRSARLGEGREPARWTGILRERWVVPAGRVERGEVWRTAGWPDSRSASTPGMVVSADGERVDLFHATSLGLELGADPWGEYLAWRGHPLIESLIDGGTLVAREARLAPEGGYWSIPRLAAPGALLAGEAAGLFDTLRLAGLHLALCSGWLAGSTLARAILDGDLTAPRLMSYDRALRDSEAGRSLYLVRNFRRRSWDGALATRARAAAWSVRGLDYGPEKLAAPPLARAGASRPPRRRDDGEPFEDQPPSPSRGFRPRLLDPGLCAGRCASQCGQPCTRFCPAGVFEVAGDRPAPPRLRLERCTGCGICLEADPYGVVAEV